MHGWPGIGTWCLTAKCPERRRHGDRTPEHSGKPSGTHSALALWAREARLEGLDPALNRDCLEWGSSASLLGYAPSDGLCDKGQLSQKVQGSLLEARLCVQRLPATPLWADPLNCRGSAGGLACSTDITQGPRHLGAAFCLPNQRSICEAVSRPPGAW